MNEGEPRPANASPQGFFSGQRKVIIAVALLAMAVGFLAFNAFQGASVYYFTVDEALAGRVQEGATVRISGKLLPDSFYRETEGTVAHFSLMEANSVLQATYDGILPELFKNEHSDIVLEGSLNQDGIFNTDTIIVKCPTKYQPADPSPTPTYTASASPPLETPIPTTTYPPAPTSTPTQTIQVLGRVRQDPSADSNTPADPRKVQQRFLRV